MGKDQKVTTNIKPVSKETELLKSRFSHCFDKNQVFQLEKFTQCLNLNEVNFSSESYGLEWLGKSYARLLASDPATTLLKANDAHNKKKENCNSENLLIKGDNLEVLKHLTGAYYEQIKMIYIDPPYNTGSDGFVYEDDRKFTAKQLQDLAGIDEERAKRILTFTQSKSNSHSAWLTFMYPRLYIAKQLLRDDGVIFISIDDNEVAQLRLMMDEIFGEDNFVGNIAWESKTKSQNTKDSYNKLQPKVEYILLYTKKEQRRFNLIKTGEKSYPKSDSKGAYRDYPLEVMNAEGARGRESMVFEIEGVVPPKGKQWQLGLDTISEYQERGDLFIQNDKIILKMRPDDEKAELSDPFWGLLNKEIGTAESAKKELSSTIENDKHGFETVKPIGLIKRLIFHSTSPNDIILDFFAGSGTTGDAVMQLNAEDGGKRRYILVQIPEPIDSKKSQTAYDFVKNELKAEPTIFEITKERLIRAAKKTADAIKTKVSEKEKEIKSLENSLDMGDKQTKIQTLQTEIKLLKEQDLGFKTFETLPIWDDYEFEADLLEPGQELFDIDKLSKEDISALLTTWKTYDGISLTEELEPVDLAGYTSYYANKKLYLMNKRFTTGNLKALLEKIDSDKSFHPTAIISFGYHFDSKNLRELSENLKSYANRKQIDIDFITRY